MTLTRARHLFDEAAGTDARGPDESLPASLAFRQWTFEPHLCVQAKGLPSVPLLRARHLFDEAAGTDARGPDESLPASHAFGPWTCEPPLCVQA